MDRERDKYSLINFEETELRLGLPGGNGSKEINNNNNNNGNIIISINNEEASLMMKSSNIGKRVFSETQVDLKLNLSSNSNDDDKELSVNQVLLHNKDKNVKPPSKAQVVGWPPVRSCRKNIMAVQKNKDEHEANPKATINPAHLVKVSMDGAPYLRKVDLKLYKSYQELSDALGKMFSSFTIGNCSSQGIMKDFMNERKLIDLLNGSEYVATYEDKDGDWMLVGDVPWKMFVGSCKRLQIMKGSEAIGLAPRAVEKCKNRT